MPTNREYLRTPIDAASTAGRFGRDFKLAARLHAKGLNPYRGRVPVFLVDLATKGNLIEPHGLHLRHSKLFNTQAAISAYAMHRDIEAFEAAYKPNNVVHIVLRPALNLQAGTEGGQLLLDEDGRCPIANLRMSQRAFNNCVQRAIAELERKQLLTPLLVARHARPCQGGESFDIHAHVVVQMEPDKNWDVDDYLSKVFGSSRVWISSIMEPGETRSFSRTSNYPVWRLANQDWSEVNDENLMEFFEQSSGLRSVDALGPFRDFRMENDLGLEAVAYGDGDHNANIEEFDGETPDVVDARDAYASPDQPLYSEVLPHNDIDRGFDSRDAATADISSFLASDPKRTPILFGCHFAWIGLTRRFVAQVGNYTTFEDLQKYYDLDAAIAFAQLHVEETHHYLFKPVTPENPSEIITEQMGPPAIGNTSPSQSEPPRQDKATLFEKASAPSQVIAGCGRPTAIADPLCEGGSVLFGETGVESRAAADSTHPTVTAEPLHDAGPSTLHPSTPENEPPASAGREGIEHHRSADVPNFDIAGITLELTVRSERGPATATLRVGLPPATCQQRLQGTLIAG